ncbi:hypothetical protein [Lacimicrobium alkaliphilum]|uniref:Uncharacterized protein n=1 Tax=Lacimicrobium alkaliphilum TaxID=1526571 RepID=A0A0U2ZJ92_9ALTE|nr:hypothetical protein [Lacimicrobium alkaliphilum]ALS99079.1 hypothetical protein AT746_12930 [Lacimicrobium alkaliphilum]
MLTNAENIIASGNRGAYVGRDIAYNKLFAALPLNQKEALQLKEQVISRYPFLNQEDRVYVQ